MGEGRSALERKGLPSATRRRTGGDFVREVVVQHPGLSTHVARPEADATARFRRELHPALNPFPCTCGRASLFPLFHNTRVAMDFSP